MLFLIYLKTLFFIFILSFFGFNVVRRGTEESRLRILLPLSVIIGVSFYIFIINLSAYLFKGISGFYVTIVILLALTVVLKKKIKLAKFEMSINKTSLLYFLIWAIFLFIILDTNGAAISGDAFMPISLAALFSRGDYPIHVPFQPDYVSFYHIGGPELLAFFKPITGASYQFLFSFFSFIVLLSVSQLLTWIIDGKGRKIPLILRLTIPLVGLISMGGFMLTFPIEAKFNLAGDIFSYLKTLPTLNTIVSYASSSSLDSLILFFHRLLAFSSFIALIPFVIYPSKRNPILTASIILITTSSIALLDEAVFISCAPTTFILSFFTLFQKGFLKWILFCAIGLLLIILQGGIIPQTIFRTNQALNQFEIIPKDQSYILPSLYKLIQQSLNPPPNPEQYTFKWIHLNIILQLPLLLSFYFLLIRVKADSRIKSLLLLMFLSSLTALVAYFEIIDKIIPPNGARFLSFSYHLSGLGIIFFIVSVWSSLKTNNFTNKFLTSLLKIIIVWFLLISITPSVAKLFPRENYHWLTTISPISTQWELPIYDWIKNNLPLQSRMMILVNELSLARDNLITNNQLNLNLITHSGAKVSWWYPKPLAMYGMDISPAFLDVLFTLDPEIIKVLKLDYIIVNQQYVNALPKERILDINNPRYFQLVYFDQFNGLMVLKTLTDYLLKAKNFGGTLYELEQITPTSGYYYLEGKPNIPENTYRAIRLTLGDRYVYTPLGHDYAKYNFPIDVVLKSYDESNNNYNYLVLAKDTDPEKICNCKALLIWQGLGDNIKLWQR